MNKERKGLKEDCMEGLKDRKRVGLVECDYLATSPPTILVSFSFTTDSRLLIALRNDVGEMVGTHAGKCSDKG